MTAAPRASILLVDDSQANLLALEAILEPLGQNLVKASSGREALRLLLKQEFALILLDVRMPGLDGIETAQLIRQRPRSEATPIMFVTAFDEAQAEMERGYSVGAADYIFKPFQPSVLRAKVSVFVDLFQKTEEVKQQALRLRRLEEREHRRRLEEAESRFTSVMEIAADAILVLDEESRVLFFNRGAQHTFGYGPGEVVNRPLATLIPAGLDGALEAHSGLRPEVTGVRKDGSQFPAEVSVSRMALDGRSLSTLIVRDVTERKRAEERVRKLNQDLRHRFKTGIDLVADLAESLEPSQILSRVLVRVVEAVQADQGVLLRLEGDLLKVEGGHVPAGGASLEPGSHFDDAGLVREALEAGVPVLGGGIDGSSRHTAVLPLPVRSEARAALLLGRRREEPFDAGDLEMLDMIGHVAAVALRNAELFLEAEAASRSKSEFLNMAAHELRTPLSVVMGYLSMLADGTLGPAPEGWTRPIEILNHKVSELNKLVDDLLLAARMERGMLPADVARIDLRLAAQEALARADARAALLKAKMLCEVPANPVWVEADADQLARILDNLVNNALTYSADRPWVRLSVSPDADLVVEDRGLGIPPERQERIFERFYRVNDPILPPQPGTGLGLYLSRQLAQNNGGTLVLERSEVGRGSTFVLRLPPAGPLSPAGASAAGSRRAAP
jgi:PAS domain S-box-containing protein